MQKSRKKCIPTERRRRSTDTRPKKNEDSIATAPPVIESSAASYSIQSAPAKPIASGTKVTLYHSRNGNSHNTSRQKNLSKVPDQVSLRTKSTASSTRSPRSSSHSHLHSHSHSRKHKKNIDTVLAKAAGLRTVGPKDVRRKTDQTVDSKKSLNSQQLLRQRKSNDIKSSVKIPDGDVTIIITDIQGSTNLWEADALAMKEALNIHDSTIRKCYSIHNGYDT